MVNINDHRDADKIINWTRLRIIDLEISAMWVEYLNTKTRVIQIILMVYILCEEIFRLIAEFNSNQVIASEQYVIYGLFVLSSITIAISFKKLFLVDITVIFIVLLLSLQLNYTLLDKTNASQIALMTNFNCWVCVASACLSARFYMVHLIVVPLIFTGFQCYFRWHFVPEDPLKDFLELETTEDIRNTKFYNDTMTLISQQNTPENWLTFWVWRAALRNYVASICMYPVYLLWLRSFVLSYVNARKEIQILNLLYKFKDPIFILKNNIETEHKLFEDIVTPVFKNKSAQ